MISFMITNTCNKLRECMFGICMACMVSTMHVSWGKGHPYESDTKRRRKRNQSTQPNDGATNQILPMSYFNQLL